MKKEFLTNALKNNLNVPKNICNHLVGEHHSLNHRMVVGVVFIVTGVYTAKLGTGVVHFVCDAVGYMIHGIGTIPFIEKIETMRVKDEDDKTKEDGRENKE